jgi:hypothetical protein
MLKGPVPPNGSRIRSKTANRSVGSASVSSARRTLNEATPSTRDYRFVGNPAAVGARIRSFPRFTVRSHGPQSSRICNYALYAGYLVSGPSCGHIDHSFAGWMQIDAFARSYIWRFCCSFLCLRHFNLRCVFSAKFQLWEFEYFRIHAHARSFFGAGCSGGFDCHRLCHMDGVEDRAAGLGGITHAFAVVLSVSWPADVSGRFSPQH